MIVSSQTMVTEAEIRVLDVKCHVSVSKDQGFQIDEVRIDESVRAEKSGSTEAPGIESVMDCSGTVQDPLTEFLPNIRSGSYADIGCRDSMDDEHICVDDLSSCLESSLLKLSKPSAFYGVFDGHGGPNAALYIKQNAMKLFFEDSEFPQFPSIVNAVFLKELESSHRRAFLMADLAMADESIVSGSCGTTALTALVIGRHLLVANAGDCRAVLCRRGTAVDLSFDHRSTFLSEKDRCEALGGYFDDGYLNGILSVTRALGDWELKKLPQNPALSHSSSPLLPSPCPLISDPDVQQIVLTEEDEFLILGCDGIWDVMSSQYAVSFARRGLRKHDDPRKCAMELVEEASRMNSLDNLTAVVVCFSPIPSLPPHRRRLRFCNIPGEARNQLQSLLGQN